MSPLIWVLLVAVQGEVPKVFTHATVSMHSDSAACEAAKQQTITSVRMLLVKGNCLAGLTESCKVLFASYAGAINSECLPLPYEKAMLLSQRAKDGSLVEALNATRSRRPTSESAQ